MKPSSYESAGVSIEKGDSFAKYIGSIASKAVSKNIGGFAGGIELDTSKYRQPVLLSTTDGVGTKLLVAQALGVFDTLGIDLVAMCVNDLVVCGAKPMVFLDYLATGRIDETLLQQLIRGVVRGCELADCTLAGGETAEMPDVYGPGEFDLAGFATGVVDKPNQLPQTEKMRSGDPVYGIPSVGVHSNGLSLARKIIGPGDGALYSELLVPTRIYVEEVLGLVELGITGAAHITGGGLEGNFSRILPIGLRAAFTWDWRIPSIFAEIADRGSVEEAEMRKVFNMGIGIAFTLPAHKEAAFLKLRETNSRFADIIRIGTLVDG